MDSRFASGFPPDRRVVAVARRAATADGQDDGGVRPDAARLPHHSEHRPDRRDRRPEHHLLHARQQGLSQPFAAQMPRSGAREPDRIRRRTAAGCAASTRSRCSRISAAVFARGSRAGSASSCRCRRPRSRSSSFARRARRGKAPSKRAVEIERDDEVEPAEGRSRRRRFAARRGGGRAARDRELSY